MTIVNPAPPPQTPPPLGDSRWTCCVCDAWLDRPDLDWERYTAVLEDDGSVRLEVDGEVVHEHPAGSFTGTALPDSEESAAEMIADE